jgi:hypothetical protein
MKTFALTLLLLLPPLPVGAQLVPEGIHSLATGAEEICGITAASAVEFEAKIRADRRLKPMGGDDRYQVFGNRKKMVQWAVATRANPAYPLATCRHAFRKDGSIYQTRSMRCDASREACDRAFLDFQALDRELSRAVSGE